MRIERLSIRNFRSLADVTIALDPHVTVLVGANNAGKTSVLDALAAVLSFRGAVAFSELDFRSVDAARAARLADPIQIELVIAPTAAARFDPAELGTQLPQVLPNGDERFILRLETRWNPDPTVTDLESTLSALRTDGQAVQELGRFPFADELPLHEFGVERDLQRGLSSRWSNWGRLVAEAGPTDVVRSTAMRRLRTASDFLIRNTPGLAQVRDALGAAGTMTGIGAMNVLLTAAPQDVDELLRRVAIELRLPGAGRAFGADRHGLGTQGALLFAVYRLHADRLRTGRPTVSPVMTIEEPETHLHPTAQRALAGALRSLPGQVIVTSHSAEMATAAGTPVLLRNVRGATDARTGAWVPPLVSFPRTLFARCVVIMEGLEAGALDLCARAMGFDLHQRGVEIVNVQGQMNIVSLWRSLGPLGFNLPVACIADADDQNALADFLNALHAAALIPQVPAVPAQWAVLRAHAYFVPRPNRNLEEVLVEDFTNDVDVALHSLLGEDFPTWRAAAANNAIGRYRTRLNIRRGRRAGSLTNSSLVRELNDREARYVRLAREKPLVPEVLSALTANGTISTRIPTGYRNALRWIERSTR